MSAEDYGLDDVDAFHAEKDKILLSQGIQQRGRRSQYDDDESDEQVMDIDSGDEDEDSQDEEFFGKKHSDEELGSEDEGAWGDKKSNYYGADDLEDEEAAKEIEQEALRQQKKHLQQLNMDDYVDEEMELEWTKSAKEHDFGDLKKQELEQEETDIASMDAKTKKKYLTASHPEFIPLAKELAKWKPVLDSLSKNSKDEVVVAKYLALSAYLGAISSYFALFRAFSLEGEPFTMKDHEVMELILSSKEVWRQANELEEGHVEPEEAEHQEEEDEEEEFHSFDEDNQQYEIEEDSEDAKELDQQEDESSDSELDIDISKPRVFKQAKQPTISEDFAEGEIADVDAEEKKTRKKTLRFYTSKIDQQARKKDEKFSGDQDIPYKERLYQRQQRLIEEARQRGLQQDQGAELDDYESEDEKTVSQSNGLDDSLYQQVKSSRDASKTKRREAHDLAVRAAKEGRLAELQENIGEDGKRAVNYQILKNKGLTPHRKKDNRNSRVKKRKKYEKAQKKLKSVRAVFEQPTGAYAGEKTGIKKNLSKSVKF
ncbi:unnamed protein product [Cyberlindnera jadinii]|uniref:Sas10 C-terminal domain-containing protein n=1 Tax=Cyberlindnera jadinii (strain ATCC 18201 / CBS 1600 / BCRC 20928 / JCM 3617 / NBRC 0987 / NRRL Y-1542) TaxID=983966 RepID=A0A0H5C9X1_CYBJN|nr:hypothetical protein CYBJADRAFT_167213 [Cyberlindnera jadinii NRRL Y-1542]ODV73779.1 hypothetical protein CYBJADRAFT_167213 [Cyberlindnera jadinii NRRL Y-1542]CEP25178.1 unnamed protein product [Cyberlindnera jadinii]